MTLFHPLAAPFHLEGSNGQGVLLIHGFGGTPAHVRMLGAHLNDSGYSIHGPLLDGHGTTLETMDGTGRHDWLSSARRGYHELASTCERVHLFGFSMGGLLALSLASESSPASLTTLNTPIKLHDRRAPFARLVRFAQRFRMWEGSEPQPEGEASEYWVQYEGFSVKAAAQLLDLIRETKVKLPQITCPLLVLQSRADESVRSESAQMIKQRTSSFRKDLVWLQRSRHNSLLDEERGLIHERVLEHIGSS